jgi:capsular exopolysaccharide synthesis family protein
MSRIDDAIRKAAATNGDIAAVADNDNGAVPWSGLNGGDQSERQPEQALAQEIGPPAVAAPAEPAFPGFSPDIVEKVAIGGIPRVSLEQYRKLASTLHQAQIERNLTVIMVTSALSREGKSLTSTNLALTLADSFHRSVLLIDADLRRPCLHEMFQLPNAAGLSDALQAETEKKLSVFQVTPTLCLLPAGRPEGSPMSLLVSDRMRRVLEEASQKFDWVIIDTPPIALLPDGHLMSTLADAVVLVIGAGETQLPVIQKVVDALGRQRIIGTVLNRVTDETAAFGDYDSYSRYALPPSEGRS